MRACSSLIGRLWTDIEEVSLCKLVVMVFLYGPWRHVLKVFVMAFGAATQGMHMNLLKRIALSLMACISVVGSHVSAQTVPPIPSKIVFTRVSTGGIAVDRVHETYPWGNQVLPAHRIATAGSGFLHHTMETTKPAGTGTQLLKFRFRSSGLFESNPDAHFAVVGRAESTSWYKRGRGFIVGGLSRTAEPCYGNMSSQPETWWSVSNPPSYSAANRVLGNSYCGPAMEEGVWYDVDLHLNSDGYWAYWIWQNGNLIVNNVIQDSYNPEAQIINTKLTGFAFGLVFADNQYSNWTLEIENISASWF